MNEPLALSIVTSMYASARILPDFHARCTAAARTLTEAYEIVLVNDGSPDDSLRVALDLRAGDPHLRIIDLSRYFGHHKALMTGLLQARGALVFLIDCDLEEEPEWLGRFQQEMTATGADVVYGVEEERKGRWLGRVAGRLFYSVSNRLLTHPLSINVVTARLMTGQYVKALVSHQERELSLAGLWAITGFDQRPVVVRKGSRRSSTYTTRKRLSAFGNAITSFSNRPLVYIFQIGTAVMALSVLAGAGLLYTSLSGDIGVPGWASIMVSIWFLGGLIIFCVGIIGIYLAKVFTEIKQRPYTIVRAEYGRKQDRAS